MPHGQVADFVDRYMPAYHAYLAGMYAAGPTTARAGRVLVVEIDERRSLTTTQPGPFHGAPEGALKPAHGHSGDPGGNGDESRVTGANEAEAAGKWDGDGSAPAVGKKAGRTASTMWLALFALASCLLNRLSHQRPAY